MTKITRNQDIGQPGHPTQFASPPNSEPDGSLNPNPLLAQFQHHFADEGQDAVEDWLYALHFYDHHGDLGFDDSREDELRESFYTFIANMGPSGEEIAAARRSILALRQSASGIPVFNNDEEFADFITARGGRGWLDMSNYSRQNAIYTLRNVDAQLRNLAWAGIYPPEEAATVASELDALFVRKQEVLDYGLSDVEIAKVFRLAFSPGADTEVRERLSDFLEDRNFHAASILMDVGSREPVQS